MKLTRLACLALVSVFPLAACNFHDNDSASTATTAAPANVPNGSGTATLSWEAPTTTTQGTALTNLAGYRIYYGVHDNLSQTVQVNGVGLQTYVIDGLGQGTWYFAIKAVSSTGAESPPSNVVTKVIS